MVVIVVVVLCVLLVVLAVGFGIRMQDILDEHAGIAHHDVGQCYTSQQMNNARFEAVSDERARWQRRGTAYGSEFEYRGDGTVTIPKPTTIGEADRQLAAMEAALNSLNKEDTDDMTKEKDLGYKTYLDIKCPNAGQPMDPNYNWGAYAPFEHRVTTAAVLKYLQENPTLDQTKLPMRSAPLGRCYMNIPYLDKDRKPKLAAFEKGHQVPWDTLQAFIDQHPQLSAVYNKTAPPKVKTKTVTTIIERPLALTDNEVAEMKAALQRQQHIRNEYVRRAYMAIERVDDATIKAKYQKELDEQLAGMATLRTLMERLDVPMDEWVNKDLALAQLALIEGKETGTDDLHVRLS